MSHDIRQRTGGEAGEFTRCEVLDAFESTMFLHRQRYPETPEDSYLFLDEVEELKRQNKHIALVDGAFDVPQPNHQWFLHHARLLAGRDYSANQSEPGSSPLQLAANDEIVLIVTLDTDARIAATKGGKHEKGGIPRPVYPWHVRAQFISNFMTPREDGGYRPLVDLVTIDGHEEELGTPHESQMALGAALLERDALDTWIFYGEHDKKKAEAEQIVQLSGNTNCQITVIPDKTNYALSPSGDPWSSSNIIKNIRGES